MEINKKKGKEIEENTDWFYEASDYLEIISTNYIRDL